MTKPLRKYLLNEQIAIEAREIACRFTRTCGRLDLVNSSADDEHTKTCNELMHAITMLAMQVKLAALQKQGKTDDDRRDKRTATSIDGGSALVGTREPERSPDS